MSQELFYTSTPRGLRAGSSGFCTVAMTRSMPTTLVERLEWLSGYRPLYAAGDPQAARNPVSYAHWRLPVGEQIHSTLSRVCFAGLDHTHRSNKFAHHLVLAASELPAGGPAWAMEQPGVMETAWQGGEPTEYDAGRLPPAGDSPPAPCAAWEAMTGDAGWAGVLVESFLTAPSKPAYLIYTAGVDMLRLVTEAIALLPAGLRWGVTFNTYFTDLPAGLTCAWRCCVAGTAAASEARRLAATSGYRVLDLTRRAGAAPVSPFTRAARNGELAPTPRPAAQPNIRQPIAAAYTASGEWGHPADTQDDAAPNTSSVATDGLPSENGADWVAQPAAGNRGAKPRRSARRVVGASWPFWAVAILWPLGVAGLAWVNLGKRPAMQPPTTAPTSPNSSQPLQAKLGELTAALQAAQGRLDRETRAEFDRGRAAGRSEPPDPRVWIARSEASAAIPVTTRAATAGHSDAEFAAMASDLAAARDELAKAKAALTANSVDAAPATPGSTLRDADGQVLAQWVVLPSGPRPPDAPAETVLAAWSTGKPAKLSVAVPPAASTVYKVRGASDGAVVVSRSSGSGLGGELERARFLLAGNRLKLRWLVDDKDDKEARAIAALLAPAILQVNDDSGNPIARLQFFEPERCDMPLGARKIAFKRPLPLPPGASLRLIALASSPPFRGVAGGGAGCSLSLQATSGAVFCFDADNRGLSTNWADQLNEAAKTKKQFDDDVESIRLGLPKKGKDQIDVSKRTDDLYKRAFTSYDQASARARQQAEIMDDLNRPVRATLALRIQDGPALATIEVVGNPPKTE